MKSIIWFLSLIGLAGLLIIIAFAKLPNYKLQIEQKITAAIEQPISIEVIETYWTGNNPTIELQQLQLLGEAKPITANIKVIVNLWQSLLQWQIVTDEIIIKGVELAVTRDQDGQIKLVGLVTSSSDKPTDLSWLLNQPNISLQIKELTWLDLDLPPLLFSELKLSIARQNNVSKLIGSTSLPEYSFQQLQAKSLSFTSSFELKQQLLNIDGQLNIEKLQYSQSIPQLITSNFQIQQQANGTWQTAIQQKISDSQQWFEHEVQVTLTPPQTLQPVIAFLLPHFNMPPTKFAVHDFSGQINYLSLEKLFELAKLNNFISEITETLLSVRGNLYDVKWSYKDIWQVEANFSNLILVLPQAKVRGFSGHLVMNPEIGHLKITKATIIPTDYPVLVTRLNGNIDLKRWQISSKKLQAVINGIPIQVAGELKMDTVPKTNLLITIENNKLENLVKHIPEQTIVHQLTEAKLTGNLNSAQIFLQGIGTEFKFKVLALIEQVNLKNYQVDDFNHISVQNLAGQLEIESNQSSFFIKRGEVKLDLQELYNKPLQFNKLQGKLIWQNQQLSIKKLRIYEDKIKILLNGNLTIPQNGETPNIDLVVSLADAQISKIISKLPAKKIPKVIEWLNNSKLKGNLSNTKAIIHGPVNNLLEQFEFKTDFKNTSIKYVDGWPVLTQAKGKIVIKEQNLTVTAIQGKSLKLRLNKPLQVKIKDLFNPKDIDITVNTQDSISDSLHFVAQTPLRDIIKLNQIDIKGQLGFNLNLSIPLDQRDIVTNVQLVFSDTTLRNEKFDFAVTNINGLLKFENQQISGKNIGGKLHGTPIKLSIFQTNKSRTILQANTTISPKFILKSLQPFAPEISQLPLSGNTPLNIKINLPSDSGTENDYIDVEMQTDLKGMEIKLPTPIGKNADKSRLLTAKLHMDSANKIVINYGKVFNGIFKLQQNELERGNLIFGNKIAQLPKQKILKIQGSLPDLSITNWLEKFESGSSSSKTNNILPIQLDFDLNKLEVVGQQLSKVKLEAKYKKSAWLATIKSDKIEGQINFQPDKISLNFKKIILSLPEETEKTTKVTKIKPKSSPPNPHDLPILSFRCDSLKIAAADLGRVKLKTKPSDDGIKMNLTAQSEATDLRAEGQWRYVVGQHQTRLKVTLDSDDMGLMLQQFGISEPPIVGGGSKISLNSYWFDAPYAVDSENLIGTLSIVTLAGNIVKANPGIGRVFGLIDVYSLPRRLNLDFRDVFDEGFGFDTIAGSFFIKKGIAHTKQFIMQGPAARIKIEGSTNLIDKKLNQIVTVYPHFSTPIAVIGALTLGLGGGAVGLIVQEALQKELEPVVNIKFHVTGDLKDPKINGE